ncbi:MAG: sugar nucleotide-binding protein [Halioglobus sp.]|nr:sugar nucleotide-binding protein [Halioglobus sp.]
MRVLVLGSDTPLGAELAERQRHLGRHEIVGLSRAACRWKSERQAKKSTVRAQCDIVVDVRIEAAGDGGDVIQALDLERCHWVAKACQRSGTPYLYVSSSRVFSGQLERPYTEADPPDSDETVGRLLAEAEQIVREGCDAHFILRLGPLFSHDRPRHVVRMLGALTQGSSLALDNNLRGAPVVAADGARVVSAVLDQLGTGIQPWGIYHYCSSDSATYYEFAEAARAAASQFYEVDPAAVQLADAQDSLAPLNRVLDCSKIRSTFAIKQVTWRSAIADLVRRYHEQQQGE